MSVLLQEYVRRLVEREIKQHCRYERLIIKTLKSLGLSGRIKSANCTDSIAPDADIKLNGESYYVEVKQDEKARMGSTSMTFSYEDQAFGPAGLNRELSDMVAEMLNEMSDTSLLRGLNRLIKFLKQDAIIPRKVSQGFPMSGFLATSWVRAKKLGMLQMINRRFNSDISVVSRHYARKNTHYIQIGGWGLYSLGANPAGLPVPLLDGTVVLEIEAKKSGDIMGRIGSKAAFRVHARLQPNSPSPYTLDDPKSIEAMLTKLDQSDTSSLESAYDQDKLDATPRAKLPKVAHVR